jgi:beta-phosphoglucomutase-like phosphatase (HAD superfamily)
MNVKPIAALVFDFDGTIIDTETPVYESWRDTFVHAGVEPIDFDVWAAQIGLADGDAMDVRALLCERLGVGEVPDELEAMRRDLIQEMLHAQPVRDGVVDFLDLAEAFGVRLAVGSSSPTSWVDDNLRRVGLRDRFEVLSCAAFPASRTRRSTSKRVVRSARRQKLRSPSRTRITA